MTGVQVPLQHNGKAFAPRDVLGFKSHLHRNEIRGIHTDQKFLMLS